MAETTRTAASPGCRRSARRRIRAAVTFRVWAAHAAHVFVVGDFNAWDASANELAAEGTSAIFGGDVAGAAVGQEYAYVVTLADGTSVTHPIRARAA